MSDYVHLEGNVKSVYKLQSTSELGDDVEIPPAPNAPVYPPELPKGKSWMNEKLVVISPVLEYKILQRKKDSLS